MRNFGRSNFQKATDFYLANRKAMDAGAEVSWEARFNHDEISALQHAMNLKFQDETAFMSEYQNDPLPEDTQIASRCLSTSRKRCFSMW